MKLSDMSVSELLTKFDFSDKFIEEFKEWCKDKPVDNDSFFGIGRLPYDGVPFLGKYIPVPIIELETEDENE